MEDCVFCKIIAGQIPGDFVYRSDTVVAFRDIHPAAPVHILIVPTHHIASFADLTEADSDLVGQMVAVANRLAKQEGIAEKGYRVVINVGTGGGQVVPHLHMHLLGGRDMKVRMG